MEEDELKKILLHTAGAIVRHKSPFEHLDDYKNQVEITQAFREEWVIPYYFNLRRTDDEWINQMIECASKISDEVILKNLGDFNWRTRSTGAYFAAIKDQRALIDIIGVHLIKSEVCRAGSVYAMVLAFFNEPKGMEYLDQYLQYYLTKLELYFDQKSVLAAVKYLDKINGTDHLSQYLPAWKTFIKDKGWQEAIDTERIEEQIKTIEKIRNGIANKG